MTNDNESQSDTLLDAWIRYNSAVRLNPEIEPDFWAWQKLNMLGRESPDIAWKLILRILNSTDHELALENLAAGPLEDLLARHGHKFIDLIEARAEADLRFRWLLAGVWKNSIPDDIWERLLASASDVPETLPTEPRYTQTKSMDN
jgi:hypothetical protein